MFKRIARRFVSFILVIVLVLSVLPAVAYAASVSGFTVSGVTASYDNGNWTGSESTLQGTATGTAGGMCSDDEAVTSTLTLKNTSGKKSVLSFTYTKPVLATGGSVKINGTNVTSAGEFSVELEHNASITVVIVSGNPGAVTSSISLNSVKITEIKEVAVSFTTPDEGGSYSVNGAQITSLTTITQQSSIPFDLVAVPHSGYKFVGWFNQSNGEKLSSDSSFRLYTDANITVHPWFVSLTTPVFKVGTQYFSELNSAINYSNSSNSSEIVYVGDHQGVLQAGTYTIPVGKTLILPFNDLHTFQKTQPELTIQVGPSSPSAYSTLTLENGVQIIVNGSIGVAGTLNSNNTSYTGANTGKYGHLKLSEGSSITINNGGALYCWGYVSGSGTIYANSGSVVYEPFQLCDMRGGTATTSMNNNSYKVMPFSQYYVQNIEAKLVIEYGAIEKVFGTATVQGLTENPVINFVGASDSMFTISSGGKFIKVYDPVKDRVYYDVYNNSTLNSITIRAGITVDTSKFILPIMENTTIQVHSGRITVNQDLCMIPGSEFIIDEGATAVIPNGKNIYIYDRDEWIGNKFIYSDTDLKTSYYSPTRLNQNKFSTNQMVDTIVDVNGTISISGKMYTTAGGANICSSQKTGKVVYTTAPTATSTTYQATQSGTKVSYQPIPVNAAWLINGDGSYFKPTVSESISSGDTVSYCAVHDKWEPGDPHEAAYNLDRWEWAEDYSTASAVFKIQGSDVEETKEATVAETVITPATCDTSGQKKVTATVEFNGDTYTSEEITVDVQPLGHTWQFVDFTWTETESGYTADANYKCSRDETHTNTVAAEITSTTTDATCNEADSVTYSATVSATASLDGNAQSDTKTVTGSALGHNMEHQEANNATCTVDGNSEYWHCTRCGKYYSDANGANEITEGSWIIQALGHNYQSVVTEPTCTEAGYTTHTCSRCNDSYVDSYVEALGHDWSEWAVTTAPTCTDAGVETRECSRCDATETRAVDALGHTAAEAVEENRIEPTCTEAGHYDSVVYCSVCNAELSRTVVEIEALGHDYKAVVTDPTCTEDGYTTYTCSRCNDSYKADHVDALGHDWNEWAVTTAPTCTEAGVETRTCSRCNATETRAVDALGHDFGEWIETTAPTCTEAGEETRTCSRCDVTETRDVEALGHDLEHHEAQAPTCTEIGWNAYDTCKRCDYTTYVVIPALDHSWNAPVWTWTDNGGDEGQGTFAYTAATATFTCANDTDHTHTQTVTDTSFTPVEGSGDNALKMVYTAEVSFNGQTYTDEKAVDIVAYYLVTDENGWMPHPDFRFTSNGPAPVQVESMIQNIVLEEGTELKAVLAKGSEIRRWYPSTPDNCIVDYAHAGEVSIYLNIDGRGDWAYAFPSGGGYIWISKLHAASITADSNGTATLDKEKYDYSETVTATLTPAEGYQLDRVEFFKKTGDTTPEAVDAGTVSWMNWTSSETPNTYTLKMPDFDLIMKAYFKEITYTAEWTWAEDHASATVTVTGTDGSVSGPITVADISAAENDDLEMVYTAVAEVDGRTYTGTDKVAIDAYYLIGSVSRWQLDADNRLALENGSYTLDVDLAVDDEIKVVHAVGKTIQTWYPASENDVDYNYVVDYAHAGEAKLLYSTEPVSEWMSFHRGGYFFIEKQHTVEVTTSGNGSAVVDAASPALGATVTLTVTPDAEYQLDSISFYKKTGTDTKEAVSAEILGWNEAAKTFTMPDYDVIIEVSFKAVVYTADWTWADDHTSATATITGTDGSSESIEADVTSVVTTAATCTETGLKTYTAKVEYKGKEYTDTETEVLPALGHDLIHHDAQAATCTAIGWDAYDTCSRCDYTTYEEIAALGHDYKAVVTDPTCTEQGFTTHTCSRCEDSYVDSYVDALGHDFGEWIETTAPTCTAAGEETRYCSRCDATETRPVEALGHNYVGVVTDPTCTAQGYTTYTCSRCGDSYKDDYVDALGHDFGEWIETTAPTCTAAGEETRYCSRCDATETRPVEALGHNYVGVVTDPTCTAQGYTTYTCTRCEDSYKDDYVDALGHDFGEWIETTAPTCTAAGEETRYCSRCDATETRPVEALGHDFVDWTVTTDPTCTEAGEETGHCSRCDATQTRRIEPLGHDYVGVVTAPTCIAQGYTTYTCSRCAHSYIDSYVDALGHDIIHHDAKAPTCTEGGWDAFETCSRCDYTTYEAVPATGHDWGAPTYVWADDNSKVTATRVCGNDPAHVETETADTTSEITVPATCTTAGTKVYKATFSNTAFAEQTKPAEVPATGHTPAAAAYENVVAPTDTAIGTCDEVVRCAVCGEVLSSTHISFVTLKSAYLSLDGKITINLKVIGPDAGYTAKLYYEKSGYGLVKEVPLNSDSFVSAEDYDHFLVSYDKIPAKEMMQNLRIKVFDPDGNQIKLGTSKGYFDYYDYSVATWCTNKINKSSDADEVMLAKALLNYGHYSQLALKYNDGVDGRPENLPQAWLADEMAAFAGPNSAYNGVTTNASSFGAKSINLELESDTKIRLKLRRLVDAAVDGMAYEPVPEVDPSDGANIWCVYTDGIPAKEMHKLHDFTLTLNGNSTTLKYGVLSWANKKLAGSNVNDRELAKAMYLYNAAARRYFHFEEEGLQ